MGAGDTTGKVRKEIDQALHRLGRSDLTRSRLIVDRTSSMTAGQIERFWKTATRRLLGHLQELQAQQLDLGEAIHRIEHDSTLDTIASEALEETIGK